MKLLISLLSFVGVFSFSGDGQTNFKPQQSSITFEISNFSVNTVYGSFGTPEGTFVFNPNNLAEAKIDVKVAVKTIDTDNSKRNGHLQAEEYFDSTKHPYIRFESTNISKTSKGFLLKGKLTIKGISKTIEVPASFFNNSLSCNFTVDRYDFKVGDSGDFMIGREVEVKVVLVL